MLGLLRSADREPLLERQQGDNEASSSAQPAEPVPRRQLPAQSEEDAENALFELRAHKVVTWTVWFLLAAVLIGTVIGVVLVSLSMQKGDGPPGNPSQLGSPLSGSNVQLSIPAAYNRALPNAHLGLISVLWRKACLASALRLLKNCCALQLCENQQP